MFVYFQLFIYFFTISSGELLTLKKLKAKMFGMEI